MYILSTYLSSVFSCWVEFLTDTNMHKKHLPCIFENSQNTRRSLLYAYVYMCIICLCTYMYAYLNSRVALYVCTFTV